MSVGRLEKITYMCYHIPKVLLEHLIKHRPLISKECINIELTDEFHG